MTTPTLVLLESNTTGTGRLFARAARAEGCEPVLLTRQPGLYPFAAEEAIEVIRTDTANEAAVLERCHALAGTTGLAGLTSTSDYYVVTAARLAARLGLPGPSEAGLRICRDKASQHDTLLAAGVRIPASRTATTPDEAVRAASALGSAVVLKPVGGSGSVGVRLCASEAAVRDHATHLLRQTVNERGIPIRPMVLLQEFIEGPEFSVESFAGGAIGITRKHVSAPPVFVETGHDFPAILPESQARAIISLAAAAVAALDLEWGAAHTELRLTPAGPVIIEVNPRLAGGFIPELIRRATGIDLIRELVRRILGKPVQLARQKTDHACIRFLVPGQSGTLTALTGQDRVLAVPEVYDLAVYRQPGARITLAGDFHDRIAHVMTCCDDPDRTSASAERALACLHAEIA